MLTAILILLVIIMMLVAYIAVALRFQLRLIAGLHRRTIEMRTDIQTLLASVAAQTTVVAGVVTFLKAHTAAVSEALDSDDVDAIREANDELQAQTAQLSQAIAVNTTASDEVYADAGGTGDETSAVDPETVGAAAAAGTGEEAGQGEQAQGGEQQNQDEQQQGE